MAYETLLVEKKDHIRVITFNRPPANAMNLALFQELDNALEEAEKDDDVRVLIITGAGEKCFSAGFDVTDAANADKTSPLGNKLFTIIDRYTKPVIAAINGHAMGGGCEIALACHFRLMADNPKAKLGLVELNLGVIPGWGGTQRMTRIIGRSKALDMILLSKRVNAREALELGIVDKISAPQDLMKDAHEYAEQLAARPPIAVTCVLKAVTAGTYGGIEEGLKAELAGVNIVKVSEDAIEGMTAFMQKRDPLFKGK